MTKPKKHSISYTYHHHLFSSLLAFCLLLTSPATFAQNHELTNDIDWTKLVGISDEKTVTNNDLEKIPSYLSEISSKIAAIFYIGKEPEIYNILCREIGKITKDLYNEQPHSLATPIYVALSDESAKTFMAYIANKLLPSQLTSKTPIINIITPSTAKTASILVDNVITGSEKNAFSEAIKIVPYYITFVTLKRILPQTIYNYAMSDILALVFSIPDLRPEYIGMYFLGTTDPENFVLHMTSELATALSASLVKDWVIKPLEPYTQPISKWMQNKQPHPIIIAMFIPLDPNVYSALYNGQIKEYLMETLHRLH